MEVEVPCDTRGTAQVRQRQANAENRGAKGRMPRERSYQGRRYFPIIEELTEFPRVGVYTSGTFGTKDRRYDERGTAIVG